MTSATLPDDLLRIEVAKAIYWVGYEARGAPDWPRNATPQTPDDAWNKCGAVQHDYNLQQADAAIATIKAATA